MVLSLPGWADETRCLSVAFARSDGIRMFDIVGERNGEYHLVGIIKSEI